MDKGLLTACGQFLARLPECTLDPAELARSAGYFGIPAPQIEFAAEHLGEYHDLSYKGVRLLIGEFLAEFLRGFRDDGRRCCEVTVPAPLSVIMALQSASAGSVRFSTMAMAAEVVTRGLLLDRRPQSEASCAKRRCGLNQMRARLLASPPTRGPDFLLQYGVLCDECVKIGEALCGQARTLSVCLPKGGGQRRTEYLRGLMNLQINDFCRLADVRLEKADERRALACYARLQSVQSVLCNLNARRNSLPLCGNSMALAQAVQLMVFEDWEPVLAALELLAAELRAAPPDDGRPRVYSFLVPFLQPEIDCRFRGNGVCLMGNAAFLSSPVLAGFGLAGSAAGWFSSMSAAGGTEAECGRIAAEAARCGCRAYLTGSFGFDRWLGAAVPMQRAILKERHGLDAFVLDADFWCENAMSGGVPERVDSICAAIAGAAN